MFVVAGVSGNTGSVVASTLLSQGKTVRVLVRNAEKGAAWKAKGAEVAVADLPAYGDPTYPMPMIASDDIGRTAARALLTPRKGQHIVNLAHPQAYSLDDAAAALGRALGRPVKAARVPDDRIADTLVGYGMPRGNAAAMQEMVIAGSRGLLAFEPAGKDAHGTVSIDAFATRLVWTRQK